MMTISAWLSTTHGTLRPNQIRIKSTTRSRVKIKQCQLARRTNKLLGREKKKGSQFRGLEWPARLILLLHKHQSFISPASTQQEITLQRKLWIAIHRGMLSNSKNFSVRFVSRSSLKEATKPQLILIRVSLFRDQTQCQSTRWCWLKKLDQNFSRRASEDLSAFSEHSKLWIQISLAVLMSLNFKMR